MPFDAAALPPEPFEVLVAGVDPELAQGLEDILSTEPILLRRLEVWEVAAQILRTDPDLLIADGRRGSGGLVFCTGLKADPGTAPIPVLLVGPGWDGPWVREAYAAGAADYLSWPLRAPEVIGRVRAEATLARVRRRLKAADGTDPLSGLPGAGRFQQILQHEWDRTDRKGTPVAILMAGIDGFETYAADNGPGAAAACLAAVGQTLQAAVERAGDLVGHLGNARYACVLPDTDVPGALAVALRVQEKVRRLRLPFATPTSRIGLTVGVGFAAAFTTQLPGPDDLFARAQRNLDRAQAKGPDRWSAGEEDA